MQDENIMGSSEKSSSLTITKNVVFTLEYLVRRNAKSELDRDFEAVLSSIGDGLGHESASHYALEAVLGLRQYMWERGAWRIWDRYVVEAIAVAETLSRFTDAATLIIYRAGLREALGDWEEALSLVEKALSLASDPDTKAEALLYRGAALHNKGNYWKAFSYFREGLAIATLEATRMRIKLKLSRTARALGCKRKAEALVDELLSWKAASKWFAAEIVLEKVGYLKSRPEEALQYAARGLELYQELRFERGIAYAELALGRVCIELNRLDRASSHLERSASLFLKSQYWPGMAHVALARGRIAAKERYHSRAAELFDESIRYAVRTGYRVAAMRGGLLSSWSMLRAGQPRAGFDRLRFAVAVLANNLKGR
jgi:tetratricopeptide (TPR) repeat protein